MYQLHLYHLCFPFERLQLPGPHLNREPQRPLLDPDEDEDGFGSCRSKSMKQCRGQSSQTSTRVKRLCWNFNIIRIYHNVWIPLLPDYGNDATCALTMLVLSRTNRGLIIINLQGSCCLFAAIYWHVLKDTTKRSSRLQLIYHEILHKRSAATRIPSTKGTHMPNHCVLEG